MKNLGICISADSSKIYELNFLPVLSKVRDLLEGWNKGLHSWFGRSNIIKINILPKFLYLFQAVQIAILRKIFRNIQTLFTKFIWAHRHPRIRRTLLSLPKQYGVLAVPDMYKYYQAVHLG